VPAVAVPAHGADYGILLSQMESARDSDKAGDNDMPNVRVGTHYAPADALGSDANYSLAPRPQ
jgi:hypothetical protein